MISIRTGRLGRLRRLAAIIGFASLECVAVALGIVALQLGRGWIPFDEAQPGGGR